MFVDIDVIKFCADEECLDHKPLRNTVWVQYKFRHEIWKGIRNYWGEMFL